VCAQEEKKKAQPKPMIMGGSGGTMPHKQPLDEVDINESTPLKSE
jgi:hypothetical protein